MWAEEIIGLLELSSVIGQALHSAVLILKKDCHPADVALIVLTRA